MEKTPARGTEVSALLAKMSPPPRSASEDFDVDVSGEEPSSTEPAWNFPPPPARPGRGSGAVAVALEPEPPRDPFTETGDRVPIPVRPLPPLDAPREVPDTSYGDNPSASEVSDTSSASPPYASFGTAFEPFEDPPERAPIPVGLLPPAEVSDTSPSGSSGLSSPPPSPGPDPVPPEDGNLAALAGFTPAWGMSAPVRALSVDGTLSNHVASLSPAVEPEARPPEPQFGGAGTVLDDLPTLESLGRPSGDVLELDPGNDARAWTGAAPAGDGGLQLEFAPDLASLDLDVRPPPELPPDPAWSLPSAPAAPPTPAAASPGLAWDDPFTDAPPLPPAPLPEPSVTAPRAPAPPMSVVLDEAPSPGPDQPDHGFFAMPAQSSLAAERSGALLPDIPEAEEPSGASGAISRGAPVPLPAISKPPSRARLGLQERDSPGTARRVSAVILNIGLAALLLLVVVGLASSWATAGRLEGSALSPKRLLQALRPGTGVTPIEVTPGTYETRSGRSLLYVRGRVLNRGAPSGRVRVRAEVWDGAQAVKTGETLAGAIATPEELWRAVSPADVEALRSRLLSAAKPVADGQQADFLVLLDEAPRDLSGLRLRISASIDR